MTLALALVYLLAYPALCALLRAKPASRQWAVVSVGALPFGTDFNMGYLYGWPTWAGTSRGYGVSLLTIIALALITVRPRARKSLPFWPLFIFYGAMVLVSVFGSIMWAATAFATWQFGAMMILFTAMGHEARDPRSCASLLSGFAIGLCYQAVISISQKLTGVVQASGTFVHQNILGLAIELTLIPLVAAALAGDRRKIVMVGIVAALICIAGSGSRATMGIGASGVVLLTLISLIRRRTPRKVGVAFAGVIILAIAAPIAVSTLNARFGGATFVTEEEERAKFEAVAEAIAATHPLGVGANQFVFVSNSQGYADRAKVGWQGPNRSVPVHNAYLLARAETGWLGQIAFTLLLVVPCLAAFRLAFRERKSASGDLVLGSGVALIANMVHNNYEFATHDFAIQSLLVLNIALIASAVSLQKHPAKPRQGPRRAPPRPLVSAARSNGQSAPVPPRLSVPQ